MARSIFSTLRVFSPETVVAIPCYNESQRLQPEAFLEFVSRHADIRFLMVDDGSTDDTLPRLHDLADRSEGRIQVQSLPTNCGKAEAVRQGILSALQQQADYVGFWDADLATPVDEIPRFRQVLIDHPAIDAVIGSRIPLLGHDIRRARVRGMLGKVFSRVASMALSLRIVDTQCGAKLFRASEELERIFSEPFAARWIFDVELIARLLQEHPGTQPPLYELPLDCWHDVGGSRLKLRDFLRAPLELATIVRKYRRADARPAPPTAAPCPSESESRRRAA